MAPRSREILAVALLAFQSLTLPGLSGCGGAAGETPLEEGPRAERVANDGDGGAPTLEREADGGVRLDAATDSESVTSAASCIAQYPASVPFDVGEETFTALPAPPGPDAGNARSPERIAELCRARGGSPFHPTEFISRQAALCIAEREGSIRSGESSRRAGLTCSEAASVVWEVVVGYPLPDPYCSGYLILEVDAVSGALLARGEVSGCA